MEREELISGKVFLHHGDSREVLRGLPDNSIDSICCDPPYALESIVKRYGAANAAPNKHGTDGLFARAARGFMGKAWDTGETAFDPEFWQECLRVLKPGGFLAAFSSTRTYHRMASAIDDGGFEIRNQLAWAYGSGFPKSTTPAKGMKGLRRDITREEWRIIWHVMRVMSGTELKPAWEPICLARKPLEKGHSIARNMAKWGTGGMNINGCRVGTSEIITSSRNVSLGSSSGGIYGRADKPGIYQQKSEGRWPANIVHDGSAEVVALFPDSAGQQGDVKGTEPSSITNGIYGKFNGRVPFTRRGEASANRRYEKNGATNFAATPGERRPVADSAARFFYSAKADRDDRLGSGHPTIKPVDLMQWLVRLITPPRGVTLDPFAGSGTTGEAAWRENFKCVLIEREAQSCDDIRRRMRLTMSGPETRKFESIKASGKSAGPDSLPLFAI